jgi:UPF0042 nucleotide-binding protein
MSEIRLLSFGFKHGPQPHDYSIVDCRQLPNPHKLVSMRQLTGLDPLVQRYVCRNSMFQERHPGWISLAKSAGTVAFGCHGGRHRSVAVVEMLAKQLRMSGHDVTVIHRDCDRS